MIFQPLTRVYLLRHARSAWAQPGERDFDRPLDEEGFAEAEIIAEKAMDRGYRPSRVVSSSALRCRQTAEAVRRSLDQNVQILFVDELYNAPLDVYLEMIGSSPEAESLMFVGHNPTMEEVLEKLAGADTTAAAIPTGYPTAGLAVLERPAASNDRYWNLVDFVTA